MKDEEEILDAWQHRTDRVSAGVFDRYFLDGNTLRLAALRRLEEFGWDWSYHAFREWGGWSVEHASEAPGRPFVPSADNPRRRALLDGFRALRADGDSPSEPDPGADAANH